MEQRVRLIQGGGSLAFIATSQPGSQLSDRSIPPRGKWLEQLSLAGKPDHRFASQCHDKGPEHCIARMRTKKRRSIFLCDRVADGSVAANFDRRAWKVFFVIT